jgi:hypothetical protein
VKLPRRVVLYPSLALVALALAASRTLVFDRAPDLIPRMAPTDLLALGASA